MNLISLKLLTIIFDEALEERLVEDLEQLGIKGYTLYPVQGTGAQGEENESEQESLRLQVLLSPELAQRALEHLAEHYVDHYAVVAYLTPAEVLRGNQYI